MRAIVTGMIATYPVGGVAWDYAQYALALERLGWEVFYLEDTGSETYDPRVGQYGADCSFGVSFLQQSLESLSPTLGSRWHFRAMDGSRYGITGERLTEIFADADLLLNVSGGTLLRDEYMHCPHKVLIDSDPGWNHFVNYPNWDAKPGWQQTHGYRAHDHFFTYAACLGQPQCMLPDMGIPWHPTQPPVVLDLWRFRPPAQNWTTVMTWNNFRKPVVYRGQRFGTKEMEFPKVERLPAYVDASLELAVGGGDAPVEHWRQLGWQVTDSHDVSRTMHDYRGYIERSRGEFSVTKNLYAATHSGWFSCRTVCYLAAGKPAVVQETGFSEHVPTGEGLFAFENVEQAADAIATVEGDYRRHSDAAREIASTYFNSDDVLRDVLSRIGL